MIIEMEGAKQTALSTEAELKQNKVTGKLILAMRIKTLFGKELGMELEKEDVKALGVMLDEAFDDFMREERKEEMEGVKRMLEQTSAAIRASEAEYQRQDNIEKTAEKLKFQALQDKQREVARQKTLIKQMENLRSKAGQEKDGKKSPVTY